jgi:IS5 family transposase
VVRPGPGCGTGIGQAHDLNAKLRTRNAAAKDEAQAVVRRKNAELADLAETAANEAERLLANAKRAIRKGLCRRCETEAVGGCDAAAGRRRGRLVRAVNDLTDLLEATRAIVEQTRQRLGGIMPDGATRKVSLHDPDARPIAKGRLGKPVEFGHKAQVVDNDDGIVLDHDVEPGNPADAPRLAPSVERVIQRTGRKPRTVTADRGYGEASVDDELHNLGVRNVVIPRKGRPLKARQHVERRRTFRKHVKWRTGCEGRISHLKRNYGWDRTMIDTTEGARTWTGHGVFAHNLSKIAGLTA